MTDDENKKPRCICEKEDVELVLSAEGLAYLENCLATGTLVTLSGLSREEVLKALVGKPAEDHT